MSNLVEQSSSKFTPTYLYIKQHSVTGKLYFGKTERNPVKYKGSGTHWKHHINIHGLEHIETLWYCLFYDKESIEEFALLCSKQWDIVDSSEWLNLKEENGTDGSTGYKHTKETKITISLSGKGRIVSEETRENMSLAQKCRKRKPHSEEHKKSLSGSVRKYYTAEIKEKLSLSRKGRAQQIITCPHCGKSGGKSNMNRYHFDNCITV